MTEFFVVRKIRENATVLLDLLLNNFDFTRKMTEFFVGEKFVKMQRFCPI